jgi:hypothetical protein
MLSRDRNAGTVTTMLGALDLTGVRAMMTILVKGSAFTLASSTPGTAEATTTQRRAQVAG